MIYRIILNGEEEKHFRDGLEVRLPTAMNAESGLDVGEKITVMMRDEVASAIVNHFTPSPSDAITGTLIIERIK